MKSWSHLEEYLQRGWNSSTIIMIGKSTAGEKISFTGALQHRDSSTSHYKTLHESAYFETIEEVLYDLSLYVKDRLTRFSLFEKEKEFSSSMQSLTKQEQADIMGVSVEMLPGE